MPRNRLPARLLFIGAVVLSAVFAYAFWRYLPEHPQRAVLAVGALAAGLIFGTVLALVASRLPEAGPLRLIGLLVLVVVLLGPPISTLWPGGIRYSRFGLTIVGAMPVPVLDVRVTRDGFLWFREKTHRVTRAEVLGILEEDVEMVIIGTGWNGGLEVDTEATTLGPGISVLTMPTPKAFEIYDRMRAEGAKVVLLAHTTC